MKHALTITFPPRRFALRSASFRASPQPMALMQTPRPIKRNSILGKGNRAVWRPYGAAVGEVYPAAPGGFVGPNGYTNGCPWRLRSGAGRASRARLHLWLQPCASLRRRILRCSLALLGHRPSG